MTTLLLSSLLLLFGIPFAGYPCDCGDRKILWAGSAMQKSSAPHSSRSWPGRAWTMQASATPRSESLASVSRNCARASRKNSHPQWRSHTNRTGFSAHRSARRALAPPGREYSKSLARPPVFQEGNMMCVVG